MTTMENAGRTRRRKIARETAGGGKRTVNYCNLTNPFEPANVFSDDRASAIHQSALQVLEELGIKVLLPEARQLFGQAGAIVDDETEMVRIGSDIIEQALRSAPRSFQMRAGDAKRDVLLEQGQITFLPGAGTPHATDLERGRRPGTEQDFRELIKLNHHFDALHMLAPLTEAQDVAMNLRHYAMTEPQLLCSDKVPFIYSRGAPQVADCFEMIRLARDLPDAEFKSEPRCYTIINTNSPRQLDIPMARGLIDFARAGQLSIITPFCLMGAMAPITVAGALTLNHAEALAAIALAQIANPGAPVCYGAFASSVDMKSGAPAFGTPEQVKASLGAGQLARLTGLPWRNAAGCAANINDAQAAHETQMSAWGAMLAGCTILVHGAGWIEGGLTISYEKLITDMEMLQIFAELCSKTGADESDIALDTLREVQPGGHFFAAGHTMQRYQSAFYEPLVADWSNFGTWSERGSLDANTRSTAVWKQIVNEFQGPEVDPDRAHELRAFIQKRTEEGGASPES
ncbi:MAG: trimethylamine methyltransferase family protein [Rhizobiaceae bacterium]